MPDIRLPRLRERREGLPEYFSLRKFKITSDPRLEVAPDLRDYLMSYRWTGNIRELRNMTENMIVMSRDDMLTLDDLPDYLGSE